MALGLVIGAIVVLSFVDTAKQTVALLCVGRSVNTLTLCDVNAYAID